MSAFVCVCVCVSVRMGCIRLETRRWAPFRTRRESGGWVGGGCQQKTACPPPGSSLPAGRAARTSARVWRAAAVPPAAGRGGTAFRPGGPRDAVGGDWTPVPSLRESRSCRLGGDKVARGGEGERRRAARCGRVAQQRGAAGHCRPCKRGGGSGSTVAVGQLRCTAEPQRRGGGAGGGNGRAAAAAAAGCRGATDGDTSCVPTHSHIIHVTPPAKRQGRARAPLLAGGRHPGLPRPVAGSRGKGAGALGGVRLPPSPLPRVPPSSPPCPTPTPKPTSLPPRPPPPYPR